MVIVIDMVIVITIAPVTISNNDSAADMILMDKMNIHIKNAIHSYLTPNRKSIPVI